LICNVEEKVIMKKLFVTVALAAAIATPAFAQNASRQQMQEPPADQSFAQSRQAAPGAFAQQTPRARLRAANPNDAYDGSGDYAGTDPDPRVRSDLSWNPPNMD
jgi:hypothetical protein